MHKPTGVCSRIAALFPSKTSARVAVRATAKCSAKRPLSPDRNALQRQNIRPLVAVRGGKYFGLTIAVHQKGRSSDDIGESTNECF
jgi:hypothetical protein